MSVVRCYACDCEKDIDYDNGRFFDQYYLCDGCITEMSASELIEWMDKTLPQHVKNQLGW